MAEHRAEAGARYGVGGGGRVRSAAAAAVIVAGIGYALALGLSVDFRRQASEELKVLAVLPDGPRPPPPRARTSRQAQKRRRGAASPPNLRSKATEIVAPPPPPVVVQPPPVIVAPVAGGGVERSSGAAPVVGPGKGSGGRGTGTGSGDGGGGDGGDGGTGAELVSNRLLYKDLPRAIYDAQATGMVRYRATIDARGRLADCRIVTSSGNSALDTATCALALRRVRFRPARDAHGRAVADHAIFEQEWTVTRGPDAEDPQDR